MQGNQCHTRKQEALCWSPGEVVQEPESWPLLAFVIADLAQWLQTTDIQDPEGRGQTRCQQGTLLLQLLGRFLTLSNFWKLPSTLGEDAFTHLPLAQYLLLPSVGDPFWTV